MAHALVLSSAARNAAADAVMALLNGGGYLDIYPGTKPAGPGSAAGATRLVRLALSSTAAGAASNGVATFNAITGAACTAAGDPTWARFVAADGTTGVIDVTCGVADSPSPGDTYDVLVLLTTFAIGLTITVTSATYTQPAS